MTMSPQAVIAALGKVMASTPISLEELIEKQMSKLLHDPQVRLALEKLAMNDNITIDEAARVYVRKIASLADDFGKSPAKMKKLAASKPD